MNVLGWAAWVDTEDGLKTFDSKEHSWDDIPDDGVVFIMLYKQEGDGQYEGLSRVTHRETMVGVDHYFMAKHREGDIYGSNNDSMEEIKRRYRGAKIKRGKWVPYEFFEEVRKEAIKYVW